MTTRPRLGVALPTTDVGELLRAARAVAAAGFDHVSFPDMLAGDGTGALDPIVTAAAVAGAEGDLTVEFGVLAAPLRPLLPMAAQLAALAHIAPGRLVVGLGIGGFAASPFWAAAGAPRRRRGAVLDETLELLPPLLRGETATVGGSRVTLAPAVAVPPLLVGGSAGTVTFERIAARADGWFPSLRSPAGLGRDVARLRAVAAARGRSRPSVHFGAHAALGRDAVTRAATLRDGLSAHGLADDDVAAMPLTGSAGAVAEQLTAYAEAGADSITLVLDGAGWHDQLDVLRTARDAVG